MLNEKLNENLYKKMDLNIMYFGSGTLSGTSTSSGGECRMLWSSSVISGTNKSNVTITFQARRTTAGSTYCTLAGTLKIDGTAKSVSKYRPSSDPWNNTWKEVGSQTKEVTHSADGSKTITVSGNINGDAASMEGNFKVSANITLDKINRASVLGNIADFRINDTITIPITKYVPTFTDKLEIKIGTTLIKTVNPITNGYSLTFTSGEKNAILALMTSPKVTMTFILTTLDGVTVQGTSTKVVSVSSLDMPILMNYTKKTNGKYQVAVNGVVNVEKQQPLQIFNDDGTLFNDNNVLWSGGMYMTATQIIPLIKPVSKQATGIVLIWSAYSGGVQNYDFSTCFVPKEFVKNFGGSGIFTMMGGAGGPNAFKYVYVEDEQIRGNAVNGRTVGAYNNATKVLRAVVGI